MNIGTTPFGNDAASNTVVTTSKKWGTGHLTSTSLEASRGRSNSEERTQWQTHVSFGVDAANNNNEKTNVFGSPINQNADNDSGFIGRCIRQDSIHIIFLVWGLTIWILGLWYSQRSPYSGVPQVRDAFGVTCGSNEAINRPYLYFPLRDNHVDIDHRLNSSSLFDEMPTVLPNEDVNSIQDAVYAKQEVSGSGDEVQNPLISNRSLGRKINKDDASSTERRRSSLAVQKRLLQHVIGVDSNPSKRAEQVPKFSMPTLNELAVEQGLCVSRCPNNEDQRKELVLDQVFPEFSNVYGYVMGSKSRVYETDQFSSFMCLPKSSEVADDLVAKLALNNRKLRIWLALDQISDRSTGILTMCAILGVLMGVSGVSAALIYPQWVPLLGVLGMPFLAACFSIYLYGEPSSHGTAATRILNSPFWMSSTVSGYAFVAAVLLAVSLYSYRKRLKLACVVISTCKEVLQTIPLITAIPGLFSLLTIVVALSSMGTLKSLVSGFAPAGAGEFDGNGAITAVHRDLPMITRKLTIISPVNIIASESFPVETLLETPQVPIPTFNDLSMWTRDTPNMYQNYTNQYQLLDAHHVNEVARSEEPTRKVFKASSARKHDLDATHLKSDWMKRTWSTNSVSIMDISLFELGKVFLFISATFFLLEFCVTINQFIVASWTCVWYFSLPDIYGVRQIEWSLIGDATWRVFTNHLGTASLIAGVNYSFRFVRSTLAPVPYISTLRILAYQYILPKLPPFFATLGEMIDRHLTTISGITIAECLLRGEELMLASESILDRDEAKKSLTRLMRFGALSNTFPLLWAIPILASLATLVLTSSLHIYNDPSSTRFIYSPTLTASVAFLLVFYIVLIFTSAVNQICDTIVSCYMLERSDRVHSYIYTPEPLTIASAEIKSAAHQIFCEAQEDAGFLAEPDMTAFTMTNMTALCLCTPRSQLQSMPFGDSAENRRSENDHLRPSGRKDGYSLLSRTAYQTDSDLPLSHALSIKQDGNFAAETPSETSTIPPSSVMKCVPAADGIAVKELERVSSQADKWRDVK